MTNNRQRIWRFRPATLLWVAGLSIGILAGSVLAFGLASTDAARQVAPAQP